MAAGRHFLLTLPQWVNSILFSTLAVLLCLLNNDMQKLPSLHTLTVPCFYLPVWYQPFFLLFGFVLLWRFRSIFYYVLLIFLTSFERCLLSSIGIMNSGCFLVTEVFFFLSYICIIYIIHFSEAKLENIFFYFLSCIFILLFYFLFRC